MGYSPWGPKESDTIKQASKRMRAHTHSHALTHTRAQDNTEFYLGKRCAYVYQTKNSTVTPGGKRNTTSVIWGKAARTCGNSSVVRAKLQSNLFCQGHWTQNPTLGVPFKE